MNFPASWVNRTVKPYISDITGKEDTYITLIFTMLILRRQTYFLLNVIFPAVLISAMAALSFYLPPDSGEKMSIGWDLGIKGKGYLVVHTQNNKIEEVMG